MQLPQIDPNLPLLMNNQPLSPTSISHTSNSSNIDKSKEGNQKCLNGAPQLVGLTQIEYAIEQILHQANPSHDIQVSQIQIAELNKTYINQIYEEDKSQFQNLQYIKDNYGKIELFITLPFDTIIEQLEISIQNVELFKKYLKVLKIERIQEKEQSLIHLKGGFFDQQKQIIEMNTCGVAQKLKITLLYSNQVFQTERLVKSKSNSNQEEVKQQQKVQTTSDKIKNEIIPLLNGTDVDIDELDDEVAMISHKKENNQTYNMKDEVSADDIKITFKEERKVVEKTQENYKYNNKINEQDQSQNSNNQKQDDDSSHTRNFNTLPRNYSDSFSQNQQDQGILENELQKIKENGRSQASLQNLEQLVFEKQGEWHNKLLQLCVKSIKIIGFNCNQIPAITNMTQLMNESFLLKKEKQLVEAAEVDQLIGILMISNKRFTQASEIFRKIQSSFIKQIEAIQNSQKQENNNNNIKVKSDLKNPNNAQPNEKKQELNKLFLKCAILELLVVESMSSSIQINDKILSIKRMTEFFMGKLAQPIQFQQQIFFSEDPYTSMIKIMPYLLKFVIMCLTHKKEGVRMASLKLLEFILETKGCSLDSTMVLILKAILKTYPGVVVNNSNNQGNQQKNAGHQDSFSLSMISSNVSDYLRSPRQSKGDLNEKSNFNQTLNLKLKNENQTKKTSEIQITQYASIKEPNSGFSQALKNTYSHTLDTYISVLSSISSHILHQLFYEVIIQVLAGNQQQSQQLSLQNQQSLNEIKIFAIKIAEKIITICQGDLILSKQALDSFLAQISAKYNNQNAVGQNQVQSQVNEQLQSQLKNLWLSIRSKVFANYSSKGIKQLIEWLVEKMTILAQNGQKSLEASNKSSGGESIGTKIEITDEETYQLQQVLDIICIVATGKKKNEEEANNLIKIKQEYCVDLYLLINPLLFWLDFSVEREERFNLFKLIYQTIKDVLENLPPKKVDLDILQIMIPILQKTTDYLANNSPSLSMLKFLDLVLKDIKQGNFCIKNSDLQYFFLEMLNNFVPYISYNIYEEVFSVFDKLLSLCQDIMTDKVLQKCIIALVDKYTMKTKSHKNSLNGFMKSLLEVKVTNHQQKRGGHSNNNNLELDEGEMDEDQISIHSKNNYFEILCGFCFFNNEDISQNKFTTSNEILKKVRNPVDQHELYCDKLQFFIDTLAMLTEVHVNMFIGLIMHQKFKSIVLGLLSKQETQLRLKCHEILEIVTNYYVQYCTSKTVYELAIPSASNADKRSNKMQQNEVVEVEFINHERLYVSQLVIQCVRTSLEQKNDSYLQFNSLILLDFLFQNLLPVPSYQNEYLKGKGLNIGSSGHSSGNGTNKSNQNQSSEKYNNQKQNQQENAIDIETMDINDMSPEFEVTDEKYLHMRLNLVFKLWPYIQTTLNSAWSNIRSICYGLICSMLKVDLKDFQYVNTSLLQSQADQKLANAQQNQNVFLLKLKQIVLPMLLSLLSSKESESKAGGLNILGSFCGLSYDFSKVKISKNLDFFKKNSNFISLGIWQLVFDLQDDWDITIKEASVVLIQLCAPREAVKYFDKVKREKENLKFTNIVNRYGATPGSSNSSRNQFYLNSGQSNEDQASEFQLQQYLRSGGINIDTNKQQQNLLSFLSGTDDLSMLLQMDQNNMGITNNDIFEMPQQQLALQKLHSQRNQQQQRMASATNAQMLLEDQQQDKAEKSKKNLLEYEMLQDLPDLEQLIDLDGSLEAFHFFVDDYTDDQIQEIISIFRNDFKPPKNLWIEKNPPSASYNVPDYYSEIYSSAIEQFNQQQMQLQQQQQQEMQMKVSGSPKNAANNQNIFSKNSSSNGNSNQTIMDALEDDLVKRCEIEKQELEKKQQKDNNGKDNNYMIFERHFEESKEEAKQNQNEQQQQQEVLSIDAEPYKFLGGENTNEPEVIAAQPLQQQESNSKQPKNLPQKQQITSQPQPKLQVTDQEVVQQQQTKESEQQQQKQELQQQEQVADSKKTDELIEEYERKINKTIQLLEEEKKKNNKTSNEDKKSSAADPKQIEGEVVGNIKSTPEFKAKKGSSDRQKKQNQQQQQQSSNNNNNNTGYISDLSRGYINNADNMKLIKQINHVFNETSLINNPLSVTQAIGKQKQKLNKSFENVIAANKYQNKHANNSKKNLSTSPKRISSSGKKSGSNNGKSNYSKKKYLIDSSRQQHQQQLFQQQQLNNSTSNNGSNVNSKAVYNMRDLNFFIKTIEKDLSEKFNKMSLKDFNSMPTTPTSILKKVEDQVKALAQKKDAKGYLSNTCPNIAQVLGSLDTSQVSSKSNQVLQVSNIQNIVNNNYVSNANNKVFDMNSNNLTPSNLQNINMFTNNNYQNNNGGLNNVQNQILSYQNSNNVADKFSFSKTQKIDLSSINKNIFGQGSQPVTTTNLNQYFYKGAEDTTSTQRDGSSENYNKLKAMKVSPKIEEKHLYTNLMKSNKSGQKHSSSNKTSKRSRGSQDKYNFGIVSMNDQQQVSESSSQTKLNKSANMIQQYNSNNINMNSNQNYSTVMANQIVKKQQISKSFIDSGKQGFQPNAQLTKHISPNQKKQPHQLQLNSNQYNTQLTTLQQTPIQYQQNQQYQQNSNYAQANSEQNYKKKESGFSNSNHNFVTNTSATNKTPIKSVPKTGAGYQQQQQYSEIIDISPSTDNNNKDYRINQRLLQ